MMDIAAFLQSFSGDSMTFAKSGSAGTDSVAGSWQSSGTPAAGDEPASFVQAIRRILDEHEYNADQIDDSSQSAQISSLDASSLMLIMQMLGQGRLDDLQSIVSPGSNSGPENAEEKLLAQLNENLIDLDKLLEDVPVDQIMEDGPAWFLMNAPAAGSTATAGEAAAMSGGPLQGELEQTLLLVKMALMQHRGNTPGQSDQGRNESDRLIGDQALAKLADPMTGMNVQRPVADQPFGADGNGTDIANSEGTLAGRQDSMAGRRGGQLLSPSMPGMINAESSGAPTSGVAFASTTDATDGAIPDDGELSATGASAHNRMAFPDNGRYDQATDQQPAAGSPDPAADAKTEVGRGATLAATRNLDEISIVHEKTVNQSDATKLDGSDNNSARLSIAVDSAASDRVLATATTNKESATASDDAAFKKAVMDQIVEKATFRSKDDRSEMRIQLKPDTLGDVRMRIIAEKSHLVVQMVADKAETKAVIENQIHQLKAELDKQGLTVGKIEVMINTGNDQHDSREQFFQMFKNHSDGSGRRQSETEQEPSLKNQHNEENEAESAGDGINYFV